MTEHEGGTEGAPDPGGQAPENGGEPAAGAPPEGTSGFDALPPETQAEIRRLRTEAKEWRLKAQTAGQRVQEFEDADKTEQQRLTEAKATAEREAAEAKGQLLRYEVAAAKGVPAGQAHRLVGSTREDLEADADAFLKDWKGGEEPRPNGPDFGAGARTSTDAGGQDMSALMRRQAGYR